MREPRWLRPLARVYLIVTSAMWVTASAIELLTSVAPSIGRCEVPGGKGDDLVACVPALPVWAAGVVGVLGVLAAYLAARLTRPRSV